jgi:cyclophilin family peptidyl-prolyl cis-trans isomerase
MDLCPKTCDNFKKLCNGSFINKAGKKLSYDGASFHRVVKGMYIQGGNLSPLGIEDSASIYEGEFADESFDVKHNEIGLVGMCKKKGFKHTNESQFYITTGAPLSFMDGKYVVFGRVVQGMRVIKMIDKAECLNEKPTKMMGIVEAGDYTFDTTKSAPASRATSGASKTGMGVGKLGKFGAKK